VRCFRGESGVTAVVTAVSPIGRHSAAAKRLSLGEIVSGWLDLNSRGGRDSPGVISASPPASQDQLYGAACAVSAANTSRSGWPQASGTIRGRSWSSPRPRGDVFVRAQEALANHAARSHVVLRQLSRDLEQLAARPGVILAYVASASALLTVLSAMAAQTEVLAGQVEQGFGQHPDAKIYRSQPGLGDILGARVLAEFGDDPGRYVDAKALVRVAVAMVGDAGSWLGSSSCLSRCEPNGEDRGQRAAEDVVILGEAESCCRDVLP
jgi:hypothetical protein